MGIQHTERTRILQPLVIDGNVDATAYSRLILAKAAEAGGKPDEWDGHKA
jgi:hypothetical protein